MKDYVEKDGIIEDTVDEMTYTAHRRRKITITGGGTALAHDQLCSKDLNINVW